MRGEASLIERGAALAGDAPPIRGNSGRSVEDSARVATLMRSDRPESAFRPR